MKRLRTAEDHSRAALFMGAAAVVFMLSALLYPQAWQRSLTVVIGLVWAAAAVRNYRAASQSRQR